MSDRDEVISLGTFPKRADEIADLTIDYSKRVPSGQTISLCTGHVEAMDGTDMDATMYQSVGVDSLNVILRVKAGTKGASYRAITTATLSGGAKYSSEVLVEVVA